MSSPVSIFPPIVSQLASPPADGEQVPSQSPTAGVSAGDNVVNVAPAPSEPPTPCLPDSKEPPVAAKDLIHADMGGVEVGRVQVDAGAFSAIGYHPVDVEQALTAANHKPGFVQVETANLSYTLASGGNAVSIAGSVRGREATLPGTSQVGYTGSTSVTHQVGPVKVGVAATLHGINPLDVVEGDPKGKPAGYRYGQLAATADSKVPLTDGVGLTLHAEAGYRASPGLNSRVNTVGSATLTDQVGPVRIDLSAGVIAAEWTDRTPAGLPRRVDILPAAGVQASVRVADHVEVFGKVGVDGRESNEDTHAAPKNYANFGLGVGVQVSLDGAVKVKR
jgi:hypothetical protein